MSLALTASGIDLLMRTLAGTAQINFTHVKIGSGTDAGTAATDLSNPELAPLPIREISTGDIMVAIRANFNNGDVQTGFRMTEIGIFATDPDDNSAEVMYAYEYTPSSSAEYVPATTERTLETELRLLVYIGDAADVTAEISSDIYLTEEDLEAHNEDPDAHANLYIQAGKKSGTTLGRKATVEGEDNTANGDCSHAEGNQTFSVGVGSHTEGNKTIVTGPNAHAEGYGGDLSDVYNRVKTIKVTGPTTSGGREYSVTLGTEVFNELIPTYHTDLPIDSIDAELRRAWFNNQEYSIIGWTKTGNYGAIVEFDRPLDSGAEVTEVWIYMLGRAAGEGSHVEGGVTAAIADWSHAEGFRTTAIDGCSHAEGNLTVASGGASHAEGMSTLAKGQDSHAEGDLTTAEGRASHAEGERTKAIGDRSHAEGYFTIAKRADQHVFGMFNIEDTDSPIANYPGVYVEIVGNGLYEQYRHNARTLDWKGNEKLAGKLTLGRGPAEEMDAATKKYVDDAIAAALIGVEPASGRSF